MNKIGIQDTKGRLCFREACDNRVKDDAAYCSESCRAAVEGTQATYRVGLSEAQYERLALLAEEMGEAIQVIGKVLRHGFESYSPFDGMKTTNRALLEKELGDVRAAMIILCEAGDVQKQAIHDQADHKRESVKQWMHYND